MMNMTKNMISIERIVSIRVFNQLGLVKFNKIQTIPLFPNREINYRKKKEKSSVAITEF